MNSSGMNTATSETLIEITVKPIWLRPRDGGLDRRHAALGVADDVLDHDDRIVDAEADGDGQRHQREIVDREAEEPHARQGAADRQRHRHRRRQRRHQPAHEQQHHQQHQHDGDQQRPLDVLHAGADRGRAVGDDRELDVRRQPAQKLRQQRLQPVHRLDGVGPGRLGDREQDRRLLAVPRGEAGVGGAVHHAGDVRQPQDGAVGGLDDQRRVLRRPATSAR